MKFCAIINVFFRNIIATGILSNNINVKENPYQDSMERPNINISTNDGRSLSFYTVDNIEEIKKYIENFKDSLESINFDGCSSRIILEILEKCAECVKNPIEVLIKRVENNSDDLPNISEEFYNIKISSLVLNDAELDQKLKKAIFDSIIKRGNINSIFINNYKILLKNEEDFFSILRNKNVKINILKLHSCEIDNETRNELFDIIKDGVPIESIIISSQATNRPVKDSIINLLGASSIIPNLEYCEFIRSTEFSVRVNAYNLYKSNNNTELDINFIPQEQGDLIRICKAILKNDNFKIKEINFDSHISSTWQECENEMMQFNSIFKDLCDKGILINTEILTNQQRLIMRRMRVQQEDQ